MKLRSFVNFNFVSPVTNVLDGIIIYDAYVMYVKEDIYCFEYNHVIFVRNMIIL